MSEEASDVPDCSPDQEDLLTRRDEHPEAEALLNALKQNQDALSQLLAKCDEPDGHYPEDYIYRFYHGSFKVYGLQGITEDIVDILQQQMPNHPLNPRFAEILQEGTGLHSERGQPKRRIVATRHILEAYFHARYFLERAIKYGRELEYPPCVMPSGWAALLYLYNLR